MPKVMQYPVILKLAIRSLPNNLKGSLSIPITNALIYVTPERRLLGFIAAE